MPEEGAPPAKSDSFGDSLTAVVKELHGQYPLLFGIGAAIVLGALAATANFAALVVVAVVLVLSLATWLVWKTRERQPQSIRRQKNVVVREGTYKGGGVANTEDDQPAGDINVELTGVNATNAEIAGHKQTQGS